jgi:hypothetical protein
LPAFQATPKHHADTENLPAPVVKKSAFHFLNNLAPIAMGVLAIITLIGLLVVLLAPSRTRPVNPRTQATNNLKQIGLAMHGYFDVHKRFPFNGDAKAVANDNKAGSWAFQILPFIEQQALFNNPGKFDGIGVVVYLCPKRERPVTCTTGPWSDYCINP